MELAGLALGSNLGDRLANLEEAVAALIDSGALTEVRVSRAVETAPIDCADDAPGFLNAAMVGNTSLSPMDLLRVCQGIERQMGRAEVRAKNADRTIDLDLLFVGDQTVTVPDLLLPHPAMHERDFVMAPLSELLPDMRVGPEGQPVREAAQTASIQSIVAGASNYRIRLPAS